MMDQNQNEQQSNENEATKCLKDLMTQYLIIKKEERKSFLEEMPSDVVNKVRALKKIQLASIYLDADFHKEVYQVERKYEFLQREAYYKRFEIINGMYEPNEVECSLPENIEDHIKGKSDEENLKTQGIPNFWLTVIKNCPELCSMIKTIDVPILEHLMDIRAITKPIQELTFSIEFHFAPNKYFTDTVLTKTYLLSCTPEAENPFIFDGPEIVKSIGCQINWNSDESVTEKIFDGNKYRSDSFFNFFNPPKMGGTNDPEDQDKIDEYLETDFEIGHFMKERLIPRAIFYYTGDLNLLLSSDEEEVESLNSTFDDDLPQEGIAGEGDN